MSDAAIIAILVVIFLCCCAVSFLRDPPERLAEGVAEPTDPVLPGLLIAADAAPAESVPLVQPAWMTIAESGVGAPSEPSPGAASAPPLDFHEIPLPRLTPVAEPTSTVSESVADDTGHWIQAQPQTAGPQLTQPRRRVQRRRLAIAAGCVAVAWVVLR